MNKRRSTHLYAVEATQQNVIVGRGGTPIYLDLLEFTHRVTMRRLDELARSAQWAVEQEGSSPA
jgi:hypothetical protein